MSSNPYNCLLDLLFHSIAEIDKFKKSFNHNPSKKAPFAKGAFSL